jgi:hypothetical protein
MHTELTRLEHHTLLTINRAKQFLHRVSLGDFTMTTSNMQHNSIPFQGMWSTTQLFFAMHFGPQLFVLINSI